MMEMVSFLPRGKPDSNMTIFSVTLLGNGHFPATFADHHVPGILLFAQDMRVLGTSIFLVVFVVFLVVLQILSSMEV